MALMAFHRDFRGYTGGHGKVWDYFGHVQAHAAWEAAAYLSPGSTGDANPWLAAGVARLTAWPPHEADALFLGGMDWTTLPDDSRQVINLVQHVRHADRGSPLWTFLARPAIRICVSHAVADAIDSTGRVNGPVHVIPAAIDVRAHSGVPKVPRTVFVGAQKQPALGHAVAAILRRRGVGVVLGDQWLPRPVYLDQAARCSVAVLIPDHREGFYLPALEAMALGCATVVPDCIGNREYVRPGVNALSPPFDAAALADAAYDLLMSDSTRLVAEGLETAAHFTPAAERIAFHDVLDALVPVGGPAHA